MSGGAGRGGRTAGGVWATGGARRLSRRAQAAGGLEEAALPPKRKDIAALVAEALA